LVLDNFTSYRVAKDLDITNRTINRYQNGNTPMENMTLKTAKMISDYYLNNKEEIEMTNVKRLIENEKDTWVGHAIEFGMDEEELIEKMINEYRDDVGQCALEVFEDDERVREWDYYKEDEEDKAAEDGFTWVDEINLWVKFD